MLLIDITAGRKLAICFGRWEVPSEVGLGNEKFVNTFSGDYIDDLYEN